MKKVIEAIATLIGLLFLLLIFGMLGTLLNGWILMITIMVAHSEWWATIPEIGYWHAVMLALPLTTLLSLAVGHMRKSSTKK